MRCEECGYEIYDDEVCFACSRDKDRYGQQAYDQYLSEQEDLRHEAREYEGSLDEM